MNDLAKRTAELVKTLGIDTDCICRRCCREKDLRLNRLPLACQIFIVCPTCGNKRCPHASDHELACTGSNEPGQAGSVYANRSA